MLPRLLAAAVLALSASVARAQYVDPNLQNLLAGLMNGGEVTLITPLTTGMLQVTSFRPSVRLDAAVPVAAGSARVSTTMGSVVEWLIAPSAPGRRRPRRG